MLKIRTFSLTLSAKIYAGTVNTSEKGVAAMKHTIIIIKDTLLHVEQGLVRAGVSSLAVQ